MAKAESKTILKAYSTVESKLPTLPLEDGQLIFVYDKKKIILDNHGVRTVYEQIQTIETEEQRNDLLAPIDSFYFVIETSILWRYSNGHWNQITTSPQEQIDKIVTEGTKQVKAVQDKGNEVLQSIPEDFQMQMESKLDKQQGVENKGKALVIGEDGNVAPGEVQSGGGDGIAIINTMSGESPLAIPDSAERVNKRLELGGKTEQVTTTGVNLFDEKLLLDFDSENYDKTQSGSGFYYYKFPVNGTVTVSTKNANKNGEYLTVGIKPDGSDKTWLSHASAAISKYKTLTPEDGNIYLGVNNNLERVKSMIQNTGGIIINEGSAAQPYEPYTGNKPSPSPEYQQEIKNSGKWNEGTQKYEVDVKVTGKNLFDSEKAKDVSKWTPCAFNANFVEIAVYVGTGSTVTVSNNTKINNPVYYYGVALKSSEDIKYSICYPGYPSSKDTHTFTATEDYIYVRCNKTSLNDVIGVCGGLQIEIGASRTDFESYKEQTLTLTSDRPITKWDRLIEQGGQIGWLYKSKIVSLTGEEEWESSLNAFYTTTYNFIKNDEAKCSHYVFTRITNLEKNNIFSIGDGVYTNSLWIRDTSFSAVQDFKAHLSDLIKKGTPITVVSSAAETEFIPLPQSEQNAIRALKTYYPTTVITVDGGEVDPDIKVTYTADTKNYIDNKFGKTINAMQTKLLELESRV